MDQPEHNNTKKQLPASKLGMLSPFLIGALYGLLIRVLAESSLFRMGDLDGAMGAWFIYGMPVATGAITISLAEEKQRRSFWYYIYAPWGAILLIELGSAITLFEGSICILLATPLFMALGSFGGVLMGVLLRVFQARRTSSMHSFAVLPILLAISDPTSPSPDIVQHTEKTIFISSTPERVWQIINNASDIRPDEIKNSVVYLIGVPKPKSGITTFHSDQTIRESKWDRGVSFQEIITDWENARYIKWRYAFTKDSFPKGSMDEHVVLGGKHFDLDSTEYTLTPVHGGTSLKISINYKINTCFNWYSGSLGKFLLEDFSSTILEFYKSRSELPTFASHNNPVGEKS